MGATVAAKYFSFVLSSVSLLAGFVIAVTVSAVFQADVECQLQSLIYCLFLYVSIMFPLNYQEHLFLTDNCINCKPST